MTFDEAIAVAKTLRELPGWHLLGIEAESGRTLETDTWAVKAIHDYDWTYLWYWVTKDLAYAQAKEVAGRMPQRSHQMGVRSHE